MRVSRRTFAQTSALAAAASLTAGGPRGPADLRGAGPSSRLDAVPGEGRADHGERAPHAHRQGAAAHDRQRHERHRARAWHEHELLRRCPLGPERAPVPRSSSPRSGELAYVSPGFEEMRAREITKFTNDVRVWQEDEDWGAIVAGILKDRGIATGKVGIEERVRFFIADGLRAAAPHVQWVLATPVTAGCRMIKSPTEIALMQRANDITIVAYKAAFATLHEGMTQFEFQRNVRAAFEALGAPGGSAGAQFGKYSAFPHGSIQPQRLQPGDVVLVDGGCSVEGYQSDITRTTVFGKPSKRQVDVWNLEKAAQAAAFKAAQVGATCESVDAAARKVITDRRLWSGLQSAGAPHRTGHGIGMDGHEWTNFVRGNKTPLAPGMCFSDEPMIAIYGEFGIRLEDCLYITENGAEVLHPTVAIDRSSVCVNASDERLTL